MLFTLPDDDVLYAALVARDDSYEGRAYVGVSSTGIFCRLTCPARKPKRENCTFYPTVADCIEAGFRPCKRCHPLRPLTAQDPIAETLLSALEDTPDHRWSENDIVNLGFDPSTVRRNFKRQFGMTFLEMARHRRLRRAFTTIADGGKVIDAQLDAGFESASAFRSAFAKLLGRAPGALHSNPLLFADWIPTPLGDMVSVSSATQLHLLEFVERKALPRELAQLETQSKGRIGIGTPDPARQIKDELAEFFSGTRATFDTPLAMAGTPFSVRVWNALRDIPAGETRSYKDLAIAIGQPTATRAVARANGSNQLALIVPCHRVIGADGSLTGYGGGLWRKQKLLDIERQYQKESPVA